MTKQDYLEKLSNMYGIDLIIGTTSRKRTHKIDKF